jgi:urease accessory protein
VLSPAALEGALSIDSATKPLLPGQGALRFTRGLGAAGKTEIHTALATSPLRLLTPKNHGSASWVYLATFGGGLVDGDAIDLRVDVGPASRALLATQASTKVYRSPRGCAQRIEVDVAAEGFFALVPDPVACFAGARYAQDTVVRVAAGATFVYVDAVTCGRSARGERWEFARYASRTRIERGGAPIVIDGLVLDPAQGDLASRMGRFDALATVIAVGPEARAIRDGILGAAPRLATRADRVESASPLGKHGAIARIAATSVERVTMRLRELLAPLSAALGDDPFARKW